VDRERRKDVAAGRDRAELHGERVAVFWWTDNALFLAAPNLRSSTRIALTDDTIVSGTPVRAGWRPSSTAGTRRRR